MTKNEEFDEYLRFYYGTEDIEEYRKRRFISQAVQDAQMLAEYLRRARYSPYLLREFISWHWNAAFLQHESSDEFYVAVRVMDAIRRLPEPLCAIALRDIQDGYTPSIAALRRVCQALEQERLDER